MDRLLRWVRDIRQATFFDIQNVSDYFWHHTEEYWDLKTMTLAPPFDFFTTRYTLPTRIYSKERGWTDFPKDSHGQECLTVFRVVDHIPAHYRGSRVIWADDGFVDQSEPVLIDHARWHLNIWLFMALGREVRPPCCWFAAIDDQGRVARQHSGKPAFWLYEDMTDQGFVSIIPVSFLHVSALALTFLNCRNVEVIKPPPPTKKRLPRKLKFESRYHKIKVNAIGQRREQPTDRRDPTGISQALHIVRGHFREYGPDYDKGLLFGKYSGRFWVASHFKGDPNTGLVTSDYEVNAPSPAAGEGRGGGL